MSHHIYTTPGFVVESYPNGEAGKFIYIFTRELGMVAGAAQGIRLGQSKLRYHAQDFSFSTFSLVRGKEVWRIVGAEENRFDTSSDHAQPSQLFVRILKTLKRLVSGEEKNEELFDVVLAAYDFLRSPASAGFETNAEYIIMLRLLHKLGYVRAAAALSPFLENNLFTPGLFEAMTPLKSAAVREINTALKESHL